MSVVAENLFEISIGEKINFIFYVPFSLSPLLLQIYLLELNKFKSRKPIEIDRGRILKTGISKSI